MTYSEVDARGQSGTSLDTSSGSEKVAAHRWFLAQVERARKTGRFAIWAPLTPALAQVLIANHMPEGSNRHFRRVKAANLATIIRRGLWDGNTHQGIAFSVDGIVNDGQHRINAVAQVGITVEVMMTFGQPRQTFNVIDQLITPRNAVDLIDIQGIEVGTAGVAAALARFVIAINSVRKGENMGVAVRYVHVSDVLEFVTTHQSDIHVAVNDGRRISVAMRARVSPSNIGAAIYLIRAAAKNQDDVTRFVDGLMTGANLDKTSPILHCREGLRANAFGSHIRSGTDRRAYEVAAVILAWNRWREGARVRGFKALLINEPKDFPEPRA